MLDKVDRQVNVYYDQQRQLGISHEEVSQDELKRVRDRVYSYWVEGWVKEYFVTDAVGTFAGSAFVLQRRATYIRAVDDQPMSKDDSKVERVLIGEKDVVARKGK